MGKVRKENGVLKLVRAGGIVELYKHPIKAGQVMERYPRHCVTRPDVFKFPYIVVKPESVLNPGRVFFIVPYHTIHRLLKSKGYRCHQHYEPLIEPDLHRRLIRQPSDKTLDQMAEIDTCFFHQLIPVENFNKKQSNHEPKVVPRTRQVEENGARCISKDGDYDSDEACAAAASSCFPGRKKKGGDGRTNLKPCLKKKETRTRSEQGRRVRFTLPDEDDDDYNDDDEKWDTDFSDF